MKLFIYRSAVALLITAAIISSQSAVFAAQNVGASNAEATSVSTKSSAYLSRAAEFVYKKVTAPTVGSIGGEWAVLGLSRSGADVPDGFFDGYLRRAGDYLTEKKGILSTRKYTEYSRVILALTSLGVDARDFRGYDLTIPLGDYDATVKQGINGAVFALLALDSGDYPMPENPGAKVKATRSMYVDLILSRQNADGGWSVSPDESSDSDMTAMALQSLTKYVSREDVKAAVDAGVGYLSAVQRSDGGFESSGKSTCESVSQVIIALCGLGIPLDDADFVKNGKTPLDALKDFQNPDGGFLHTAELRSSNLMASEQALCALAAAKRAESGMNAFYVMSDAGETAGDSGKFPGRDGEIKRLTAGVGVEFLDIAADDPDRGAINALSARGIINGRSEGVFAPDGQMTRTEFCTIVVRALGLEQAGTDAFGDVGGSDWFFGYVGKAYSKGIVNGVGGGLFDPGGTITREAASVMVARAAKLCGFDTSMSKASQRDVLSQFSDYKTISDWASEGLAFCYSQGILDESELNVRPGEAITRREVASMLYKLLTAAELM